MNTLFDKYELLSQYLQELCNILIFEDESLHQDAVLQFQRVVAAYTRLRSPPESITRLICVHLTEFWDDIPAEDRPPLLKDLNDAARLNRDIHLAAWLDSYQ